MLKVTAISLACCMILLGNFAIADEINGNGRAEIVVPVSILELENLEFGLFASSEVAGTVTRSTGGQLSATGGVELMLPETISSGRVEIGGEPLTAVSLWRSDSVTVSGSARDLTANTLTDPIAGQLVLTTGSQAIRYGATLYVPANTPSGEYQGTIRIDALYE